MEYIAPASRVILLTLEANILSGNDSMNGNLEPVEYEDL